MKNKDGFTLVELLAIILVLSSIFLVCFPIFNNMAKRDKRETYNDKNNSLCLSGETYIYSNLDIFNSYIENKQTIVLNINELISYGIIEEDVINSLEEIENDSLIYTVLSDLSLECTYVENN